MVKDGKLFSFQKLKETFGLEESDHYRYLQIKDYYEKEVKTDSNHEIINVFQRAYKGNGNRKIISVLYKIFLSEQCSTLYIREKWERELGELPKLTWSK